MPILLRLGFSYGEAGFILQLFRSCKPPSHFILISSLTRVRPPAKTGNVTRQDLDKFFVEERFPENWYRKETPFEFSDIILAVNLVEDAHLVHPGKKDKNGTYVLETKEMNPWFETVSRSESLGCVC